VSDGAAAGPKGTRSARPRLERLLFRRRFYLQLVRIALARAAGPRTGAFVSLMGGIGDLVNALPSIDALAAREAVEVGTGAAPYRTFVEADPHVQAIWAPFVYKPARRAHRALITRVLRRFYARVVLLDNDDARWWTRGVHLLERYARACGVPPPSEGRVHLTDAHRREAAAHLERLGLRDFIYVTQLVRGRRAFRSWPLAHYHALYELLRERTDLPVVVDATGSDETALPAFCRPLGRLGIMPACALLERARLFIGPDSGLTHVAGALGTPTVAIHLGFPPETCAARGPRVEVVTQPEPFADPALTTPAEVVRAVARLL
jgi:ADP-heptose:LPS heptosyltransferase